MPRGGVTAVMPNAEFGYPVSQPHWEPYVPIFGKARTIAQSVKSWSSCGLEH